MLTMNCRIKLVMFYISNYQQIIWVVRDIHKKVLRGLFYAVIIPLLQKTFLNGNYKGIMYP